MPTILILLLLFVLSVQSYSQFKIANLDSVKYNKIENLRIRSITELEFSYNKGIVLDSFKIEEYKEYNKFGKLLKVVRPHNWSPFLHGPLNEDSIHYNYDSLGQLTESYHFYWNKTKHYKNYYFPHFKIVTTFNEEQILTDSTVNFLGNNGNLSYFISYKDKQQFYRGEYLYDKFNRLSTYHWIDLRDNDTVVNIIYVFDDSKRSVKEITLNFKNDTMSIEITKYNRSGIKTYNSYKSFWDNLDKEDDLREYFYKYNENNTLSEEIRFVGRKFDGKTKYKYDGNDMLSSRIYYLDDNNPFILNVYKYEFYK